MPEKIVNVIFTNGHVGAMKEVIAKRMEKKKQLKIVTAKEAGEDNKVNKGVKKKPKKTAPVSAAESAKKAAGKKTDKEE